MSEDVIEDDLPEIKVTASPVNWPLILIAIAVGSYFVARELDL